MRLKVESLKKICLEYQKNYRVNAVISQQDKTIQGLYCEDAQDGSFYSLLARVMLAGFSEKHQLKVEHK